MTTSRRVTNKVADCPVTELVAAVKIDPGQLDGELRRFVQSCKDKGYGSHLGEEAYDNYEQLMRDALENGERTIGSRDRRRVSA